MKVSVIIRTRNEEKTISQLLEKLKTQSFQDFETILVDNNSIDKTNKIIKKYKIDKYIYIPEGKFSHPKSLNDAIAEAKGDLIAITNGHCVPFTNTWLEDGLKNFKDPKVAGVTGGYVYANEKPKLIKKVRLPIANLSNTNSIIRKDLWKKYHFDESLSGGEDYDWGLEMRGRGYKIILDPGFIVRHYHKITPKTRKYWAEMVDLINAKKRHKPLSQYFLLGFRRFKDRNL